LGIIEKRSIITAGFIIVIPISILIICLIFFSQDWLAFHINPALPSEYQFEKAIGISALGLLPIFISRVPQGFLLGQYKNGVVRFIETTNSILIWIGAVFIAYMWNDLILMGSWSVVIHLITMVCYFTVVVPYKSFIGVITNCLLRKHVDFSFLTF